MDVLQTIRAQIAAASGHLDSYRPDKAGWAARAEAVASQLVPWLIQVAPSLQAYVANVLNAPLTLRAMWDSFKPQMALAPEQIEAFDRQLALDDVLRESVTGEVVSKVVSRFLIENHPAKALCENGPSDYPDLFLATQDYSILPHFKRKKAAADEYGAATKGPRRRPVRVPDGLEIKTARERIAVDCHFNHAGLHLALVFSESHRFFSVIDVQAAFLQATDYREAERNTATTTVKFSFNGDRFVSLLPLPAPA